VQVNARVPTRVRNDPAPALSLARPTRNRSGAIYGFWFGNGIRYAGANLDMKGLCVLIQFAKVVGRALRFSFSTLIF
jgi:hypothetical protein